MNKDIKDELMEIAPALAGVGNDNSYRVPDNYFEDLAGEIMSRIQLPSTALPLTPPPYGYFEGLAGNILDKIKSNGTIVEANNEVVEELKALSPVVAGIKKVNVYTVPEGYFGNFKVAIPEAAQKTKVIPMHQPVRWMRFAAAAVVVGVVAVSGIFLLKTNDSTTGPSVPVATNLATVSDAAITNYLKESPADMDIITPAAYDDSKINAGALAEQLLNDVSDTAIQEYLKENMQPGEKDIKGI